MKQLLMVLTVLLTLAAVVYCLLGPKNEYAATAATFLGGVVLYLEYKRL